MKIISYSLWGKSKLYLQGAIDNITLVHKYYPSWMPRFYVAENCLALKDLEQEAKRGNCEVIIKDSSDFHWGSTCGKDHQHPSHLNMIWRYESVFDPNVEVCIFRDCDSRVSAREADSVQEWTNHIDLWAGHSIYERQVHHDNGGVMPGTSGLNAELIRSYGGTLDKYIQAAKQFIQWYSTEGYNRGYRFVHYDIWHYRNFFFDPLDKMGSVMKCGYGTNRPLKVSIDPKAGEVGSTINEEWRFQEYLGNS